ncbi:MAG: flp pilus-assembly TadE/G-like family protein [Actinomycetaceae bacterium]|nr:flp pilus-assembly TadE/G-like family protein [Actinomycetaceae bacterium]
MREETGSGTVFSLTIISATLVIAMTVAVVVSTQSFQTRAQSALDLAALEGARTIGKQMSEEGVHDPCVVAGEVALANEVHISECTIVDAEIYLIGQHNIVALRHPTTLHIRSRAHLPGATIFKFDN